MSMKTLLTAPLSEIGFGAFHIGRVPGKKYLKHGQEIPNEDASNAILNGVLDSGIRLIDTAPSYGLSEERIGKYISERRTEYNLCSKVGELFQDNKSNFDFTAQGMLSSVESSLRALRTDSLDILLLHAPPNDLDVLNHTDAIETLQQLKQEGKTRSIGFSGKTVKAQLQALEWADVMMIEYSLENQSNEPIILEARDKGKIVLLKKVLQSGHLPAKDAINFIRYKTPRNENFCAVLGSSSLQRMKENYNLLTA